MTAQDTKRVAVIGASGIGKHHAKWWAFKGADVCAFAGTSDESVAKTAETLEGLFPFQGRTYTNVPEMLEKESPDFVDVSSPPHCHFDHVKAALGAGCHVLCEKPFVYDPASTRAALLAQANELVDLAQRAGKRLGICTQYTVGAVSMQRIWHDAHPDETITHYHGHLESPAKGRDPDPLRVWIDLAPHVISVLQAVAPDAEIVWETLDTRFEGYQAAATFDVTTESGARIHCDLVTRNRTEAPSNIRHFKINGYPFDIQGHTGDDGMYCARIETPGGDHIEPDFMHALVGRFLEGRPAADGRSAVTNLDWLLGIFDTAQPGPPK
jgi:predicted dehydrogenase